MYAKNKQSGAVEEFDDSSLPELVKSGQYDVEDRDYEFEDEMGERRKVSSSEVKKAIDLGYRHISDGEKRVEDLKAKYGDSPLKAALLSGSSEATFGIAPKVLEYYNLLDKDEREGLAVANPTANIVGGVTGAVAPIVLSGGYGLVGKVASKLPTAMLAKGAEKVGSRVAQNITSEIAKKAVQFGVEGAVEGAAFGGLSALTEEALGDKEFNAEAVLYKAGLGGMLGAAGGAALGAGSAALSKATKSAQNRVLNTMIDQVDGDEAIKKEVKDRLQSQTNIEEGILSLKDPEIQRLKEKYKDIPLTSGMESALKPVKQIEDYLFDAPSVEGDAIRESAKKITKYVDDQIDSIFVGAKEASPEEAGDLIKQTLFAKVNAPRESGKAVYEEIMNEFGGAPVQRAMRSRVANKIMASDAWRIGKGGPEISRLMGVLGDTEELTLRQVKSLQSDIGASMRMAKSGSAERELLQDMYDQTRMLQENAIRSAVGGTKAGEKVVKALDGANKLYVEAYKAKDEIGEMFGVKARDFDTLLDKLEGISSVELEKKFMNIKYSDKTKQIMNQYPEIGKLVLGVRQNKLIKEATLQDGSINYLSMRKKLQAMPEDERMIYFSGDKKAYDKFIDMTKIFEKRPKTLNPSGTDIRTEVRNMFNPRRLAENYALKQVYKGNDSFVGKMVNKVLPNLAGIEQSSNSVKNSVVASVNGFNRMAVPSIAIGMMAVPSDEKLKKTEKTYKQIMEDPNQYIDKYLEKNRDLFVAAPQTATALQSKVIAAAQFLKSKLPLTTDGYLASERQPSKMELTKFADYVDAVENPKLVLKNIQNGYVSPAQVEALRVVYPKIYSALQAELMNRQKKDMSRTQRSNLQLLLGAKVTPAMSQAGFAMLQGKPQQSGQVQQMQQSTIKPTMTGMKNIDSAGRTASGLDTVLNRRS